MPVPALPIPHNPALRNTASVRREYRDLLQRPMSGSLTLEAVHNYIDGQTTISGAPVKVPVVEGVLSLDLPPGAYMLRGTLWGMDESQMTIGEEFTIEEAS